MEEIAKIICNEILLAFQLSLESPEAVNKKSGTNLKDSNLYNDANVDYDNDFNFTLYTNYYIEYIISGRRPKAKRVPVKALIKWASRKGIPNDNNTIYAIREAIYRDGIAPRPIIEKFYSILDNNMNNIMDKIADNLLNEIIRILNDK